MDAKMALLNASASKANGLQGKFNAQDKAELKKQTDEFEAILIKQLLDESLNTSVSLFGRIPGEEIYKSMYTDALSKELAGSFGYSRVLFDYLTQK